MSFSNDQPLVANQLGDTDYSDNFDDFLEQFDRENKKWIDAINTKEGGLYQPQEIATFQKYFDPSNPQENRNVYRKVIDFGALPNNSTKRVQHNITFTNIARLTRMYGASTNPSTIQFIPLPFASPTLANNVTLELNSTDVVITTGSNRASFTETTVVLEYIKG